VNVQRFETFLEALPRRRRHVVEFRDPSWYADEVLALLARHRVALCLHDMAGSTTGMRAIGPFVYVRFHGGAGAGPREHQEKYGGRYSDAALDRWAAWLAERAQGGSPIYAFFNNDTGGHAPRDAVRLRNAIHARTA